MPTSRTKSSRPATRGRPRKLTPDILIAALKTNPRITIKRLAKKLRVTPMTVYNHLHKLDIQPNNDPRKEVFRLQALRLAQKYKGKITLEALAKREKLPLSTLRHNLKAAINRFWAEGDSLPQPKSLPEIKVFNLVTGKGPTPTAERASTLLALPESTIERYLKRLK